MDELTIYQIIIGILSVLSLIISIIALFINWKKFIKDKPILKGFVIKSSYTEYVGDDPEGGLTFNLSIQFSNKGQAPGSITDLKAFIRYPERLFKQYPHLKYQIPKFMFSATPTNIAIACPFTIQANGAENKEFEFVFKDIIFEYLDRCGMPLDFKNPKKWEWNDLPIWVRLVADTSSGEIEFMDCCFRVDQEESKIYRSSLNFSPKYGGPNDDFSPKVDFDELK